MNSRKWSIGASVSALLWLGFSLSGGVAAKAQSLFLLTGAEDGAQWQIGRSLAWPPVPGVGVFQGGREIVPLPQSDLDGDGRHDFPPLNVLPKAGKWVMQGLSTAQGGSIQLPEALLSKPAPGVHAPFGVRNHGVGVFPFPALQIATSINYAFPYTQQTLAPGSGPGPGIFGGHHGGVIVYDGGTKAFGGAAQFEITPGPGAGTGRLAPNEVGAVPLATIWLSLGRAFGTATRVHPLGASVGGTVGGNPNSLAQIGAPVEAPPISTMFSAMAIDKVNVSTPDGFTCCSLGPNGTILSAILSACTVPRLS